MKKLKDEIEKVRVENATLRKSNKRMKEDHDDFMVKNADLFGATKKLDTVEKELDVLKINMEEAQESLRASKANEKAQLREIHTAKTEIKELQSTLEKSKLDLNLAVTEKVEMATTLGKAMETLETNKQELEQVNELNLDVTRRMQAMEADAAQLAAIHEKEMLEISKQIDGLRFEIKDLQLQKLEQEVVQQKLETALKDAKEEIDDLSEVNKNQELELLDNAEELEQFEEEIGAMQQFIRDRSKYKQHLFYSCSHSYISLFF